MKKSLLSITAFTIDLSQLHIVHFSKFRVFTTQVYIVTLKFSLICIHQQCTCSSFELQRLTFLGWSGGFSKAMFGRFNSYLYHPILFQHTLSKPK